MAKKKRKGGNPRNQTGGRVTKPPCRPRSYHYEKEMPCKHSSTMKIGNGPKHHICSWCGSPKSGKLPPMAKGPDPEPVPDEWFSTEEPVMALSIPEWQEMRARGQAIQRRSRDG